MAKRHRTTRKARASAVEKSGDATVLSNVGNVNQPRGVEPSSAWEKLKRKQPSRGGTVGTVLVGPSESKHCRCWEPWINGHHYKCKLWQQVCAECNFHNGLHRYGCSYWKENAGQTPF